MAKDKYVDFKEKVLDACKSEILDKLTILEKELKYLSHDIAQDTKSSAGDKFETSREMANAEIDKLQGQVNSMNKAVTQLNILPISRNSIIAKGSLVKTDKAWIYISVSLGQLVVNNEQVLVISPAAPLSLMLLGKKLNEVVTFNKQSYKIIDIY
jgi:hypothetical protein